MIEAQGAQGLTNSWEIHWGEIGKKKKCQKFDIVDDNFGQNGKLNVRTTDSLLLKRALKRQNRGDVGIFSMKKGLFKNSCYKQDFWSKTGLKRQKCGYPWISVPNSLKL